MIDLRESSRAVDTLVAADEAPTPAGGVPAHRVTVPRQPRILLTVSWSWSSYPRGDLWLHPAVWDHRAAAGSLGGWSWISW